MQAETEPVDTHRIEYLRVDSVGMIAACSTGVAVRTGLDRKGLVGFATHVLAHPDMPRIMAEDALRRRQMDALSACYVCARDARAGGAWYHLLGLPQPEGRVYLMTPVRSDLWRSLRPTFAALRADEGVTGCPDADRRRVEEVLRTAGFADHPEFQARITVAETAARNPVFRRKSDPMDALAARLAAFSVARGELLGLLSTLFIVPTNMRILASRLEPTGGPLGAIAESYKRVANEMTARIGAGDVQIRPEKLIGRLNAALFHASTAGLISQAIHDLRRGGVMGDGDVACEQARLAEQMSNAQSAHSNIMAELAADLSRLGRHAEALHRLMTGLDQVRILGEVESRRRRDEDTGLPAIMAQLYGLHGSIRERLATLAGLGVRLHAV